jgi:tetratricopeptide (TPR) repeat protein
MFKVPETRRLHMDDARAWYISGMTLQAQDRHPEALLAFEQSLALDSGNAGAWNGKGLALANLFGNVKVIRPFSFWQIPLLLYSYFLIESCPVCSMCPVPVARGVLIGG